MSRIRNALSTGGVLVGAALGLLAPPALASVTPPTPKQQASSIAWTCAVPLSEPTDLPQVASPASLSTYSGWGAGTAFPVRASFTDSLPGLGRVLAAADAASTTLGGTWTWRTANGTQESTAPVPVTGRLTTSVDALDQRVEAAAGPPAGVAKIGVTTFDLVGLTYAVQATTSTGQPADFSFVDDGDGDPSTLTISCSGPQTRLGTLDAVADQRPAPPTFGPITVTDRSATFAATTGYLALSLDGRNVPFTRGPDGKVTIDGLTPATTYRLTGIVASVVDGISDPSAPVTFTTRPGPTQALQLAGPGNLNVQGSLTGNTATQGRIAGALTTSTGTGTGTFAGETEIGSAVGSTTALGFIPIRATFAFSQISAATGVASADGGFSVTTTQDIALKVATVLGVRIATGSCHTATPPSITLKSTTPGATFFSGGTVFGQFTLGRLTGCSSFGSIFGSNGGRGALSLKLAPPAPTAS